VNKSLKVVNILVSTIQMRLKKRKMVAYGPSTFDIVAVYEATAIEQAQYVVERYGELRVYYPPASLC